MIVGSEEKNVLDGGAIPPISTKKDSFQLHCNLFYTEREWSRMCGWGNANTGMTSFDRAQSTQTDDPKGA